MSTKTTNLNLDKPELVDDPNVTIPQLANNFDVIDESLAQNAAFMQGQFLNVKAPLGTTLTALKGDGTDETTAFQAIITYASQHLPMTLFFPNGTYGFTDLGSNIAYTGLTILGATDRGVVFKCLNTAVGHTAINFDAFYSGLVVGFVQKCNVKNIIFEGNSETEVIVNVQGLARCNWENVYARVGKADTTSKGFYFKGVNLAGFKNIMCSTQLDTMSSIPYYGIYIDEGFRAGTSVGASSNITFDTCYFEGLSIGGHFQKCDQAIFIGGSFESCSVKGLEIPTITNQNRYNTFIGTGFENDAATLDVDDGGMSTSYQNCYASKYMKLNGHRQKITGGMYNTIELSSTALNGIVENVKVNYFGGTGAGLIDSGTSSKWRGIYNNNTSANIYPAKARTGITVGASPYTWTNTTGNLVHLFIGGGTVSNLQSVRNGGDPFAISYNSNTQPLMLTIPPNDGVTVTYTAAPGMSYRELNGF